MEDAVKKEEEYDASEPDYNLLFPETSEDQAVVLDKLEAGCHVIVSANPGSGKTKLIEQIVHAFPKKNVLVVSFNTELVQNTKQKMELLQPKRFGWVSVHTYHNLMGTLVGATVCDDIIFGDLLRTCDFKTLGENWKYNDFDFLVIDEAQDLKERFVLLMLLLIYVVTTRKSTLQMIFLHDEKQTIYSFYPINKADARYVTLAESIFGPYLVRKDWCSVSLPVSYRLTHQITTFLNALMPALHILSGQPRSEPHNWVTLYIADPYRDSANIILDIVRKEGGNNCNYGKIVILFNSLKSPYTPARSVVDLLVANQIPVYVSRGVKINSGVLQNSEEQNHSMFANIQQNKVRCLTDCSGKGLEFDVVIKVNESELLDAQFVTNSKFVALTRAKKRLYIIQSARHTTEQQLDNLLSHPKITQSILRVIIKRQLAKAKCPLPIDPLLPAEKKTDAADDDVVATQTLEESKKELIVEEEDEKTDVPIATSCTSMFAFMDVSHVENLLHQFSTTIIESNNECQDTEQKDELRPCKKQKIEDKDEDLHSKDVQDHIVSSPKIEDDDIAPAEDDDNNHMIDYLQSLIITHDKGKTFFNFCDIANQTLIMALEFAFTRHLPKCIQFIVQRLGSNNDDKSICMRTMIEDAKYIVTGLHSDNQESFMENIAQNLQSFAKFATVYDAYHNYRDLLFYVENFDFIQSDGVKMRFETLYYIINNLCQREKKDVRVNKMLWNYDVVGRFMRDDSPFEITHRIDICFDDFSMLIHFSRDVEITHNDRLCAIAASLLPLKLHEQNVPMRVYVVNMISLVVERLELTTDATQPLVDDSFENMAQNLRRRLMCPFLEDATNYKFWQQKTNISDTHKQDVFVRDILTKMEPFEKKYN